MSFKMGMDSDGRNVKDKQIYRKIKINIFSRMTPSGLSKCIAEDSQQLFDKRGKMDLIVLLDEDTSEDKPLHPDKPISILRKIFLSV